MTDSISEWIESHLVDDERFGEAYASVPDEHRALLKTLIARLWDWSSPERFAASSCERIGHDGWATSELSVPADWAVFVCGPDLDSPARLLSAVVPAIAAGVKEILAIRIGGSAWAGALLTALELAGVELVAELDEDRLPIFFNEMNARSGHGRYVFLGTVDVETEENIQPISLPAQGHGIIVGAGQDSFDFQALRFAHPTLEITVYGDMPIPDDILLHRAQKGESWQNACANVAFVANQHVRAAAGAFPLVLASGNEFCWIWPSLRSASFVNHSVCWTNGA